VQELTEQQTGGPGTDDYDLGAHSSTPAPGPLVLYRRCPPEPQKD
jgi:hypothetical protein